jgi:TusA-related sulfurtransferase
MATNSDSNQNPNMKFESVLQMDVPKGRDGKHKKIVTQLLAEIEQLAPGSALKVPLTALPDSKENIRAALNRATRQRGLEVATSSDETHLYIWCVQPES